MSEEQAVAVRRPALITCARPRDFVAVTTPALPGLWREVVDSDAQALLSQTPEWTSALCGSGRYQDASRMYELPGGRRAVLPLLRLRGSLSGLAVEASLPAGYGIGGLVASGGVRSTDIAAVFNELAARRTLRTSLAPNPLQSEAWQAASPAGAVVVPRLAHVLTLEGGFDHVWKHRFKGTARTAVRKAQRSGLTVQRDAGGELVDVFYELFERSLSRWADQQHEPRWLTHLRGRRRDPIEKIQAMASLGEGGRIWVAFKDERPAAAILVLQGRNAHYTRGVMDKEIAGPTRANYLLHSLAIEEACAAGCRWYHMGESGQSRPLAQFKTRFGARPYPYAQYHLERLPLTAADRQARDAVKRMIGFRD